MASKSSKIIMQHVKGKDINNDSSSFYNVIHSILIARWIKSYSPLHCMARSLNPSDELIYAAPNRHAPHEDEKISMEKNKCLKKLFRNDEDRMQVSLEYANFSSKPHSFDSFNSIEDIWTLDPKSWWVLHALLLLVLSKESLRQIR
ncbi:hypothetical protein Lal_00035483 [Lupinus albus]|nr:hypothetical protein Lal_00035483 [Lupinus albus]